MLWGIISGLEHLPRALVLSMQKGFPLKEKFHFSTTAKETTAELSFEIWFAYSVLCHSLQCMDRLGPCLVFPSVPAGLLQTSGWCWTGHPSAAGPAASTSLHRCPLRPQALRARSICILPLTSSAKRWKHKAIEIGTRAITSHLQLFNAAFFYAVSKPDGDISHRAAPC